MKDQIKKAFQAAEQELENKEILLLKERVKSLLQKKSEYEKERDEAENKIRIIKQDIEDFKAGRLDKVKERHEINPEADKVNPIKIVIINDNSRQQFPTQPWKWNYGINWTSDSGLTDLVYRGSSCASFTTGTYTISGTSSINGSLNAGYNIISL